MQKIKSLFRLLIGAPITVEEWNEKRQKFYESVDDYPVFREDLLCTGCRAPILDQFHIDHSVAPPRRQVICSVCNRTDYRYLGEGESCHKCPVTGHEDADERPA